MMDWFVFLSLVIYAGAIGQTTCPCGWTNSRAFSGERIIGGAPCEQNEFPFIAGLVRLKSDGTYRPFCGGTIIATRHVVSAAHCLDHRLKDNIGVLLGSHDRCHDEERREVIPVISKVLHEGFKRHYGQRSRPAQIPVSNDIALVVLERPITFNAIIGPACMPVSGPSIVGRKVTIIGWGTDVYEGPTKSKMTSFPKKTVDTQVITDELCAAQWDLHGSTICTSDDEGVACRGDSGGPVVYFDPDIKSFTLVGVVSFVPKGCTTVKPSVHTRVDAYIPWILKQMGATTSSPLCTKSVWGPSIAGFPPEFPMDDLDFIRRLWLNTK